MKRMFIVEYRGIADYETGSLYDALAYIGRQMSGFRFACMCITARQAQAAGYAIRSQAIGAGWKTSTTTSTS
jgi:hypothetical protein